MLWNAEYTEKTGLHCELFNKENSDYYGYVSGYLNMEKGGEKKRDNYCSIGVYRSMVSEF